MAEEKKAVSLSRSEREAQLKDKAGFIVVIFAILLALCTYFSAGNSSKILTNTLEISNTYSFYQAKSTKQGQAKYALHDAERNKETAYAKELRAEIARYESEPQTGEGKTELRAKGEKLKAERDEFRKHSSWYTYTSMLYQIAIVFLTASILAVNRKLYTGSLIVGVLATILFTQAVWLWLPL